MNTQLKTRGKKFFLISFFNLRKQHFMQIPTDYNHSTKRLAVKELPTQTILMPFFVLEMNKQDKKWCECSVFLSGPNKID